MAELLDLARQHKVPVSFVDENELDRMARGGNHQGVALEIEPLKVWTLDEALEDIKSLPEQIWIALDEVEDPHNVGAILRSAACFGAQAAILPHRRTAQLTPTVEKVACGGVEAVKVISVVNLNQALLQLKENGFWIYGAAAASPSNLTDGALERESVGAAQNQGQRRRKPVSLNVVSFARPTLLVIGSEAKGLREKVAEKCDVLVAIPQVPGPVESLNASCAAAVLLYEIARQSKSCSSCA